jgi:hypothetical protein
MLTRRNMLRTTAAVGVGLCIPKFNRRLHATVKTTQPQPEGFFTLDKRDGRWWLITPEGQPFFSIGLNHIDPASLRFPENVHIWRDKYGNSMKRWLTESVAPNLKAWGFNSVGWTQEVVTRGPTNHRHSRHFTADEYAWLDMPYCHQLPFADFHQWEFETRNPDVFSLEFADWCDHVAREHCVPLADDSKLIGYFYIDCPTWVHIRKDNTWKGAIVNPERAQTDEGRAELTRIATQYYQVQHDAIRRYDKHHLILGDRYEANAPIAMEVINAAKPYVDVLSFQDFRDPVGHLKQWYEKTGMPVIWADGSRGVRHDGAGDENWSHNDGAWWGASLAGLRENPGCVGAHLCGAYIRNRCRRRGLIDPFDTPDTAMIPKFIKVNRDMQSWIDDATKTP